jgi:hypothetical protein
MSEPQISKPSEKFRKAMRQILSVPKAELDRREGEYQSAQKEKRKHSRRHR